MVNIVTNEGVNAQYTGDKFRNKLKQSFAIDKIRLSVI